MLTQLQVLSQTDHAPISVRIPLASGRINARAKPLGGGRYELRFSTMNNRPEDVEEFRKAVWSPESPRPVGVEFAWPKYDGRRVEIGMLRSAYLISFAALGYRYVLHPALDIVRRQIAEPDRELIAGCLQLDGEGVFEGGPDKMIGTVDEPAWLQSILVKYGPITVFLPAPWGASDLYGAIEAHSQEQGLVISEPYSLSVYDWPAEPRHQMDFS